MVERLHRVMKAVLMCIGKKEDWVELLPTVILGHRASIREDVDVSPAEFVFEKALRLPILDHVGVNNVGNVGK